MLPKFDIFNAQDEKVASVKVKFSIGIKKLAIESEVFGDYFIRGGILAWDFAVYQGTDEEGPVAARISKKIVSVRDAYRIDIMSGNEAFIMALCILLDFLYHRNSVRFAVVYNTNSFHAHISNMSFFVYAKTKEQMADVC